MRDKEGRVKTGVMLCGHGSRDPDALTEFEALAAGLAARACPATEIATGYLEFARPMIRDGLEELMARGRAPHPGASPPCCSPRATSRTTCPGRSTASPPPTRRSSCASGASWRSSPSCWRAAAERIEAGERAARRAVPRSDTLLVVVGRGTTDPDANSNIAKLARMLWEGMGFGWAEVAFSGVA